MQGTHGERGDLGSEPPAGSRGKAACQWAKPPEAEKLSALECPKNRRLFWPFWENHFKV